MREFVNSHYIIKTLKRQLKWSRLNPYPYTIGSQLIIRYGRTGYDFKYNTVMLLLTYIYNIIIGTKYVHLIKTYFKYQVSTN